MEINTQEIERKLANWEEVKVPHAMWNRSVHNSLFPTGNFVEVILYDNAYNRLGKIVAEQDTVKQNLKTSWESPIGIYYATDGTMTTGKSES